MAQALLKTMSRDQQEWENQFGYDRFVHDCISREKYAYSQGEQRGIAEGEHKRASEAARNALAMGLTAEQAAQITGLPLDEVQALQEA